MKLTKKEAEAGLKRIASDRLKHEDNIKARFYRYSKGCEFRKRTRNDHACRHPHHSRGIQTAKERAVLLYCRMCNCPTTVVGGL